jgi:hypothetical protein
MTMIAIYLHRESYDAIAHDWFIIFYNEVTCNSTATLRNYELVGRPRAGINICCRVLMIQ